MDIVVLLEASKQRLQQLLDAIIENSEKVINVDKSKSMSITSLPLVMDHKNINLEQVKDFKRLGSWIDSDGKIMTEIERRIGQSTGAFNRRAANIFRGAAICRSSANILYD